MTRPRLAVPTVDLRGSTAADRAARRQAVGRVAAGQAGVVHRRQLYALGMTRWQVMAEVRARRWTRLGPETLSTGAGPITRDADWWRAVLEVGPRAALAGVSALQAEGLRGITSDVIHAAAPKSARPRRARGVFVHETRRLREEDVATHGLPRMRPAPAAVLAALWARSDREAALFLVATVQQRLTSVEALQESVDRVRRHPRRRLLRAVLRDVSDGAQSLGELDFARMCRSRGLPAPSRQRLVRLPSGRIYLDVAWDDYCLVVEIDGVQHLEAAAQLPDAFRQNEVTLTDRTVLRIPVIALRCEPEPFLDQVERALRAAGWRGPQPVRPTQGAL